MKVTVDPDRCQGHARCVAFAPDLFEIDSEGTAVVREGEFSAEHALQAARNCPEQAINISTDDSEPPTFMSGPAS